MKDLFARALTVLPLVALATGCGLKTQDEGSSLSTEGQTIVADATEADDTVSAANALTAAPTFALTAGQMTLLAAVQAQSRLGQFLERAACVDVSLAGNVVTYTFNKCTGPWGLAVLSGKEIATFSPGATLGTIAISMHSEGMTLNNAAIQHHADVTVTFANGEKQVSWQGGFSGVTAKGRTVQHTANLTWATDLKACTTLNGTTETTIGQRGLSLAYHDLKRCGARVSCPSGEIVATGAMSHASVTLTFDGTDELVATGPNGGEKTITLECRPATP